MDEKRRFVLIIGGGIAALLFLLTRFCLPLARANAKLEDEYHQLKQQVEEIERFSQNELDAVNREIDAASADLARRFPADGKLKLVEYLTQVPVGADVVFTEIAHRESIEMEGFKRFPVSASIKVRFYDLLKYLARIEEASLMIGVDSLTLRRLQPEAEILDVKATFSCFQITAQPQPTSKYLEEKYNLFDTHQLEKLVQPIKLADSELLLLSLQFFDPFVPKRLTPRREEIVEPKPLGIDGLNLKGILHIGEEKAALINDVLVKEGDHIEGLKVLEIQDYKVVLLRSGKEFILKMGVADELIKP